MAIDTAGQVAYATLSSGATATTTYDQVKALNLAATDSNPPLIPLTLNNQLFSGSDDIAVAQSSQLPRKLFVVINPPAGQTTKHALVYVTGDPAAVPALVNLQQNTTIRLAHNHLTDHMMVSYEDIYRVGMVNQQNVLVPDFVPVQIGPVWIAPSPDDKRVYVLNYWSQTISDVPAARFAANQQIPLQPLVTYRAGVLNAFSDLLGGLLQYLKDCFCDHLLVDCPTCDTDDKIYLACISIKNNKVFKVCNFSHRKYVHTFPTWEYWLSIVPILPFIRKAVEEMCCAALPGFFGRFTASTPAPPVNTTIAPQPTIKSADARNAVTVFGQADFRGAFNERVLKVKSGGTVINDAITTMANRNLVPGSTLATSDIANQPVADARTKLDAARVVVVDEEVYDPNKGGQNLTQYVTAPVRLEEGERVTLVTKDGKVLFYRKAGDASPDVVKGTLDASTTETLQLRQEVNSLRAELLQVRQNTQADLQARDAQIVSLQTAVRDAQTNALAVQDVRDRLDRLEKLPPR